VQAVRRQDNYVAFWRGVSAQMVVIGHSLNMFLPAFFMQPLAGGRWIAPDGGILYIQGLGVVIFFLISGYIVTKTSLVKALSGTYDTTDFIIDRGTRILTPLIPAAVLVYLLDHFFFVDGQITPFQTIHLNLPTLAANVLLLFNNPILAVLARVTGIPGLDVTRIGTAQPFWSVVVEWWIYVGFGVFAITWCIRRRFGILSLTTFVFAILYPWALLIKGLALPIAWILGSLYCLAEDRMRTMPDKAAWIITSLTAVMTLVAAKIADYNFYDPIFVCVFSATFLFGHRLLDRHISDGRRRMPALLNLWSDYSYSIYLVHFSLLTYLTTLRPAWAPPWVMIAGAFVIANLVAWLFWFTIERQHGRVRTFAHRVCGKPAHPPRAG